MGIKFSHNAWSGSAAAFNEFRAWLALQAGIDLSAMQGFGGERPWGELLDNPLTPLFSTIDTHATIPVAACKPLADRITELSMKRLTEATPVPGGPVNLDSEEWVRLCQAERFAGGCYLADELSQDLTSR